MTTWPKVNPKQSFPALEERILQFWETEKIFAESVAREAPRGEFTFFDGPPFATGLPHYGHILQSVLKDAVPRYKTMAGYRVPRRWGWDCHGLPVENLIEKELGLADKKAIEDLGVAQFNAACEASVLRFAEQWRKFVPRIGRWVEMGQAYKTMDKSYMESVWWVFGQLWEKGLIYEGLKPMHICPRCVTPLSNFEVGLGYKDVTDLSATVKFRIAPGQTIGGEPVGENTFFLAWTTTPWTLPGNVALAVNPEVFYATVEYAGTKQGEVFVESTENIECGIVAIDEAMRIAYERGEEFLWPLFESNTPWKILKIQKGSELVGLNYKPLFPYFARLKAEYPNAFTVRTADFVTTADGTGIVHIAPAYGEDDLNVAKKENLPTIQHVGMDGIFKNEVVDFAGLAVKPAKNPRETDEKIVQFLVERGQLFRKENYKHSYPHCWRCDTPLLNFATASWFVAVEKIKPELIKANAKINWLPGHVKDGRFGQWLANARDWAISRNRYWGAPLPVWRCEACEKVECVSSVDELEKLSGTKVIDLHKQFVDELAWPCSCGGTMRRIPEVLDCWFESGSMPYAAPFGDTDKTLAKILSEERVAPPGPATNESTSGGGAWGGQSAARPPCEATAQFIAEAQDQTRGWFYTLHVLAVALRGQPAFANVVCSGLILAEDGQKMSKSKKNYPDPNEVVQRYGADALRLYLLGSPVVRGEALRFSERGVEETLRGVLLPLWNTFYFFTTYAAADGWQPDGQQPNSTNPLDRWILSELHILTRELTARLDAYELQDAVRPLAAFLDGLTNWYVRRSRRRFWKSESDADKSAAYATLLHVLTTAAQLLAPFCPFLAEEIYRGLTGEKSVHLAAWPVADAAAIDAQLSREVAAVRQIVSAGLAIRAREKVNVRQPLAQATVALPAGLAATDLAAHADTIREELNVKKLEFAADPTELAEVTVAVNARAAGPRLGGKIQAVIAAARAGQFAVQPDGAVAILDEVLAGDEVAVGWKGKSGLAAESAGGVVVALDTAISPELAREGRAREIVRAVQDLRKKAALEVADRIVLAVAGADEILADRELASYLATETLAVEIVANLAAPLATAAADGVQISLQKAAAA